MATLTIDKPNCINILESLKQTGRFFTVYFLKKDGTERKLTGRFGIKKYLKGGKSTIPEDKYFVIFDLHKQEYRAVNKETIFKLKTRGETYEVTK